MTLLMALGGCGDDDGGGEFCEAGTLDCICHPALPTGCNDGLTCTANGCKDCAATPGECADPDAGM